MRSTDLVDSQSWSALGKVRPRLELSRLALRQNGWGAWIAPVISVAVICAVIAQIDRLNLVEVWKLVPASPIFWFVYAAWYLIGPASDWIIFRRLWQLPLAGFVALIRKLISNELLLGYAGEVYFYGWARSRAGLTGAPFGAIKDVAILSALVGNLVTLLMLIGTWPLIGALHLGIEGRMLLLSVGVILSSSCVTMLFRRRLFTLPAADLRFIAAAQLVRITAMTLLAAMLWHIALPSVSLSWWVLLATVRLLISRLPFVPGKDLVFAGVAIFLIGREAEISDTLAMIGGLTFAVHLLFGAALAIRDVVGLGLEEA